MLHPRTGPLSITALLEHGTEADQLREMLRDVYDPELGVDIVSLGLLYDLQLTERVAAVLITTTTPACPLGSYISTQIEQTLLGSGAVDQAPSMPMSASRAGASSSSWWGRRDMHGLSRQGLSRAGGGAMRLGDTGTCAQPLSRVRSESNRWNRPKP